MGKLLEEKFYFFESGKFNGFGYPINLFCLSTEELKAIRKTSRRRWWLFPGRATLDNTPLREHLTGNSILLISIHFNWQPECSKMKYLFFSNGLVVNHVSHNVCAFSVYLQLLRQFIFFTVNTDLLIKNVDFYKP